MSRPQLPCVLYGGGAPPIPRTETTLVVSVTLAGFFQGLTSPLFYELSAELIYPVKEGGKGAETGERERERERERGGKEKNGRREKRLLCTPAVCAHDVCAVRVLVLM